MVDMFVCTSSPQPLMSRIQTSYKNCSLAPLHLTIIIIIMIVQYLVYECVLNLLINLTGSVSERLIWMDVFRRGSSEELWPPKQYSSTKWNIKQLMSNK